MFRRALAHPSLGAALVSASLVGQSPQTVAEASAFRATSTHAEVEAFLAALPDLEFGDRLVFAELGRTTEGRTLPLVIAADPACEDASAVRASGKLRILINANIHGGEVEGKTAVQMLLREIAQGQHEALLERAVLLFVPNFNADGNDRIDAENRADQNGPIDGVGERANAMGLDLNRDFVKAESPEVRAMLAAFVAYDPHLFMDLHTTNGSHHGYHLTYAPSLATNVDATIDEFARGTLIPEVRAAVGEHGFRIFDYGLFPWNGGPTSWSTYDHRPRFGTNYHGLRNRLSLLSEAYSYLAFEQRVAVTHAFVVESMTIAARHAEAIEALCDAADRRLAEAKPAWFGYATELEPPHEAEILVGSVTKDGKRTIASPDFRAVRMPVRVAFRSQRAVALPAAWAVVEASPVVRDTLLRHGLEVHEVTAATEVAAEVFVPRTVTRSRREFQGHHEVTVTGDPVARSVELPAGALVIPAAQPLARVAAQLLEPLSEDSLITWNLLDDVIQDPATAASADTGLPFPVVRLREPLAPAMLARLPR